MELQIGLTHTNLPYQRCKIDLSSGQRISMNKIGLRLLPKMMTKKICRRIGSLPYHLNTSKVLVDLK
jgi:hypothetical protein